MFCHFQNPSVSMSDFFNLPCLNVIWRLVNGTRFDYGDERLAELIAQIEAFTMEPAIGPLGGLRLLKYIPPYNKIYARVKGEWVRFQEKRGDFKKGESLIPQKCRSVLL